MHRIMKGTFEPDTLSCPRCESSLVPPVPNICNHIAFYWIHGPVDDPFLEYLHPQYHITPDDLLDTSKLERISEENYLQIHVLDEEDADYPTQIILGIRQNPQ